MQSDRTRELTIVAQDPLFTYPQGHPKEGQIVTARIHVPAETLSSGPRGYRVHCIDYDATTNTYYNTNIPDDGRFDDPDDKTILGDPSFHCQNVYALVMHTLARFEFALGRRVSWGFYGHQLKVAPHAFAEANAFYSEEDHSLLFGYFFPEGNKRPVFTSLSHDVVVHETTHALLDGLRTRYTDPSSADQAAFHEGFSDVIALLSVFSLREVPELLITRPELQINKVARKDGLIPTELLTPKNLRRGIGGLAEEVGKGLFGVRANALRESLALEPETTNIDDEEFEEPHRRGEVFVAAIMNAFIELWSHEIGRIGARWSDKVDRSKVVEEGARLADVMLTSAIRALDYTPPVDLTFSDYLSAFLTADLEIRSQDPMNLREIVRKSFESYGIKPITQSGVWDHAPNTLRYDRTHFEPMQSDPDEVFHWVWENRTQEYLGLLDDGYTRILSVRPCVRVGPDGFILRETVSEYIQVLKVRAGDLPKLELEKPESMPAEQELYLYGGGALIFDEYGRLKYHVYNPLHGKKQNKRIAYLWKHGYYRADRSQLAFAGMHRMRAIGGFAFGEATEMQEVW